MFLCEKLGVNISGLNDEEKEYVDNAIRELSKNGYEYPEILRIVEIYINNIKSKEAFESRGVSLLKTAERMAEQESDKAMERALISILGGETDYFDQALSDFLILYLAGYEPNPSQKAVMDLFLGDPFFKVLGGSRFYEVKDNLLFHALGHELFPFQRNFIQERYREFPEIWDYLFGKIADAPEVLTEAKDNLGQRLFSDTDLQRLKLRIKPKDEPISVLARETARKLGFPEEMVRNTYVLMGYGNRGGSNVVAIHEAYKGHYLFVVIKNGGHTYREFLGSLAKLKLNKINIISSALSFFRVYMRLYFERHGGSINPWMSGEPHPRSHYASISFEEDAIREIIELSENGGKENLRQKWSKIARSLGVDGEQFLESAKNPWKEFLRIVEAVDRELYGSLKTFETYKDFERSVDGGNQKPLEDFIKVAESMNRFFGITLAGIHGWSYFEVTVAKPMKEFIDIATRTHGVECDSKQIERIEDNLRLFRGLKLALFQGGYEYETDWLKEAKRENRGKLKDLLARLLDFASLNMRPSSNGKDKNGNGIIKLLAQAVHASGGLREDNPFLCMLCGLVNQKNIYEGLKYFLGEPITERTMKLVSWLDGFGDNGVGLLREHDPTVEQVKSVLGNIKRNRSAWARGYINNEGDRTDRFFLGELREKDLKRLAQLYADHDFVLEIPVIDGRIVIDDTIWMENLPKAKGIYARIKPLYRNLQLSIAVWGFANEKGDKIDIHGFQGIKMLTKKEFGPTGPSNYRDKEGKIPPENGKGAGATSVKGFGTDMDPNDARYSPKEGSGSSDKKKIDYLDERSLIFKSVKSYLESQGIGVFIGEDSHWFLKVVDKDRIVIDIGRKVSPSPKLLFSKVFIALSALHIQKEFNPKGSDIVDKLFGYFYFKKIIDRYAYDVFEKFFKERILNKKGDIKPELEDMYEYAALFVGSNRQKINEAYKRRMENVDIGYVGFVIPEYRPNISERIELLRKSLEKQNITLIFKDHELRPDSVEPYGEGWKISLHTIQGHEFDPDLPLKYSMIALYLRYLQVNKFKSDKVNLLSEKEIFMEDLARAAEEQIKMHPEWSRDFQGGNPEKMVSLTAEMQKGAKNLMDHEPNLKAISKALFDLGELKTIKSMTLELPEENGGASVTSVKGYGKDMDPNNVRKEDRPSSKGKDRSGDDLPAKISKNGMPDLAEQSDLTNAIGLTSNAVTQIEAGKFRDDFNSRGGMTFSTAMGIIAKMERDIKAQEKGKETEGIQLYKSMGEVASMHSQDAAEDSRKALGLDRKRAELVDELLGRMSIQKGIEMIRKKMSKIYRSDQAMLNKIESVISVKDLNAILPDITSKEIMWISLLESVPEEMCIDAEEVHMQTIFTKDGLMYATDKNMSPDVGSKELIPFRKDVSGIISSILELTLSDKLIYTQILEKNRARLVGQGLQMVQDAVLIHEFGIDAQKIRGRSIGDLRKSGIITAAQSEAVERHLKGIVAGIKIVDLFSGASLDGAGLFATVGLLERVPNILLSGKAFGGYIVPYGSGLKIVSASGKVLEYAGYHPHLRLSASSDFYGQRHDETSAKITSRMITHEINDRIENMLISGNAQNLSMMESIAREVFEKTGIRIKTSVDNSLFRSKKGLISEYTKKPSLKEVMLWAFLLEKVLPREFVSGLKEINKPFFSFGSMPSYDDQLGAISIPDWPGQSFRSLKDIEMARYAVAVVHEVFHGVWKRLPLKVRDEFIGLSWRDRKPLGKIADWSGEDPVDTDTAFFNEHSQRTPEEDFCESGAFFVCHGKDFKDLSSISPVLRSKYEFMRSIPTLLSGGSKRSKEFIDANGGQLLGFSISEVSFEKRDAKVQGLSEKDLKATRESDWFDKSFWEGYGERFWAEHEKEMTQAETPKVSHEEMGNPGSTAVYPGRIDPNDIYLKIDSDKYLSICAYLKELGIHIRTVRKTYSYQNISSDIEKETILVEVGEKYGTVNQYTLSEAAYKSLSIYIGKNVLGRTYGHLRKLYGDKNVSLDSIQSFLSGFLPNSMKGLHVQDLARAESKQTAKVLAEMRGELSLRLKAQKKNIEDEIKAKISKIIDNGSKPDPGKEQSLLRRVSPNEWKKLRRGKTIRKAVGQDGYVWIANERWGPVIHEARGGSVIIEKIDKDNAKIVGVYDGKSNAFSAKDMSIHKLNKADLKAYVLGAQGRHIESLYQITKSDLKRLIGKPIRIKLGSDGRLSIGNEVWARFKEAKDGFAVITPVYDGLIHILGLKNSEGLDVRLPLNKEYIPKGGIKNETYFVLNGNGRVVDSFKYMDERSYPKIKGKRIKKLLPPNGDVYLFGSYWARFPELAGGAIIFDLLSRDYVVVVSMTDKDGMEHPVTDERQILKRGGWRYKNGEKEKIAEWKKTAKKYRWIQNAVILDSKNNILTSNGGLNDPFMAGSVDKVIVFRLDSNGSAKDTKGLWPSIPKAQHGLVIGKPRSGEILEVLYAEDKNGKQISLSLRDRVWLRKDYLSKNVTRAAGHTAVYPEDIDPNNNPLLNGKAKSDDGKVMIPKGNAEVGKFRASADWDHQKNEVVDVSAGKVAKLKGRIRVVHVGKSLARQEFSEMNAGQLKNFQGEIITVKPEKNGLVELSNKREDNFGLIGVKNAAEVDAVVIDKDHLYATEARDADGNKLKIPMENVLLVRGKSAWGRSQTRTKDKIRLFEKGSPSFNASLVFTKEEIDRANRGESIYRLEDEGLIELKKNGNAIFHAFSAAFKDITRTDIENPNVRSSGLKNRLALVKLGPRGLLVMDGEHWAWFRDAEYGFALIKFSDKNTLELKARWDRRGKQIETAKDTLILRPSFRKGFIDKKEYRDEYRKAFVKERPKVEKDAFDPDHKVKILSKESTKVDSEVFSKADIQRASEGHWVFKVTDEGVLYLDKNGAVFQRKFQKSFNTFSLTKFKTYEGFDAVVRLDARGKMRAGRDFEISFNRAPKGCAFINLADPEGNNLAVYGVLDSHGKQAYDSQRGSEFIAKRTSYRKGTISKKDYVKNERKGNLRIIKDEVAKASQVSHKEPGPAGSTAAWPGRIDPVNAVKFDFEDLRGGPVIKVRSGQFKEFRDYFSGLGVHLDVGSEVPAEGATRPYPHLDELTSFVRSENGRVDTFRLFKQALIATFIRAGEEHLKVNGDGGVIRDLLHMYGNRILPENTESVEKFIREQAREILQRNTGWLNTLSTIRTPGELSKLLSEVRSGVYGEVKRNRTRIFKDANGLFSTAKTVVKGNVDLKALELDKDEVEKNLPANKTVSHEEPGPSGSTALWPGSMDPSKAARSDKKSVSVPKNAKIPLNVPEGLTDEEKRDIDWAIEKIANKNYTAGQAYVILDQYARHRRSFSRLPKETVMLMAEKVEAENQNIIMFEAFKEFISQPHVRKKLNGYPLSFYKSLLGYDADPRMDWALYQSLNDPFFEYLNLSVFRERRDLLTDLLVTGRRDEERRETLKGNILRYSDAEYYFLGKTAALPTGALSYANRFHILRRLALSYNILAEYVVQKAKFSMSGRPLTTSEMKEMGVDPEAVKGWQFDPEKANPILQAFLKKDDFVAVWRSINMAEKVLLNELFDKDSEITKEFEVAGSASEDVYGGWRIIEDYLIGKGNSLPKFKDKGDLFTNKDLFKMRSKIKKFSAQDLAKYRGLALSIGIPKEFAENIIYIDYPSIGNSAVAVPGGIHSKYLLVLKGRFNSAYDEESSIYRAIAYARLRPSSVVSIALAIYKMFVDQYFKIHGSRGEVGFSGDDNTKTEFASPEEKALSVLLKNPAVDMTPQDLRNNGEGIPDQRYREVIEQKKEILNSKGIPPEVVNESLIAFSNGYIGGVLRDVSIKGTAWDKYKEMVEDSGISWNELIGGSQNLWKRMLEFLVVIDPEIQKSLATCRDFDEFVKKIDSGDEKLLDSFLKVPESLRRSFGLSKDPSFTVIRVGDSRGEASGKELSPGQQSRVKANLSRFKGLQIPASPEDAGSVAWLSKSYRGGLAGFLRDELNEAKAAFAKDPAYSEGILRAAVKAAFAAGAIDEKNPVLHEMVEVFDDSPKLLSMAKGLLALEDPMSHASKGLVMEETLTRRGEEVHVPKAVRSEIPVGKVNALFESMANQKEAWEIVLSKKVAAPKPTVEALSKRDEKSPQKGASGSKALHEEMGPSGSTALWPGRMDPNNKPGNKLREDAKIVEVIRRGDFKGIAFLSEYDAKDPRLEIFYKYIESLREHAEKSGKSFEAEIITSPVKDPDNYLTEVCRIEFDDKTIKIKISAFSSEILRKISGIIWYQTQYISIDSQEAREIMSSMKKMGVPLYLLEAKHENDMRKTPWTWIGDKDLNMNIKIGVTRDDLINRYTLYKAYYLACVVSSLQKEYGYERTDALSSYSPFRRSLDWAISKALREDLMESVVKSGNGEIAKILEKISANAENLVSSNGLEITKTFESIAKDVDKGIKLKLPVIDSQGKVAHKKPSESNFYALTKKMASLMSLSRGIEMVKEKLVELNKGNSELIESIKKASTVSDINRYLPDLTTYDVMWISLLEEAPEALCRNGKGNFYVQAFADSRGVHYVADTDASPDGKTAFVSDYREEIRDVYGRLLMEIGADPGMAVLLKKKDVLPVEVKKMGLTPAEALLEKRLRTLVLQKVITDPGLSEIEALAGKIYEETGVTVEIHGGLRGADEKTGLPSVKKFSLEEMKFLYSFLKDLKGLVPGKFTGGIKRIVKTFEKYAYSTKYIRAQWDDVSSVMRLYGEKGMSFADLGEAQKARVCLDIAHEVAHDIWNHMPEEMRTRYSRIKWYRKVFRDGSSDWHPSYEPNMEALRENPLLGGFITRYSTSSPSEDFAEHFAIMTLFRGDFKILADRNNLVAETGRFIKDYLDLESRRATGKPLNGNGKGNFLKVSLAQVYPRLAQNEEKLVQKTKKSNTENPSSHEDPGDPGSTAVYPGTMDPANTVRNNTLVPRLAGNNQLKPTVHVDRPKAIEGTTGNSVVKMGSGSGGPGVDFWVTDVEYGRFGVTTKGEAKGWQMPPQGKVTKGRFEYTSNDGSNQVDGSYKVSRDGTLKLVTSPTKGKKVPAGKTTTTVKPDGKVKQTTMYTNKYIAKSEAKRAMSGVQRVGQTVLFLTVLQIAHEAQALAATEGKTFFDLSQAEQEKFLRQAFEHVIYSPEIYAGWLGSHATGLAANKLLKLAKTNPQGLSGAIIGETVGVATFVGWTAMSQLYTDAVEGLEKAHDIRNMMHDEALRKEVNNRLVKRIRSGEFLDSFEMGLYKGLLTGHGVTFLAFSSAGAKAGLAVGGAVGAFLGGMAGALLTLAVPEAEKSYVTDILANFEKWAGRDEMNRLHKGIEDIVFEGLNDANLKYAIEKERKGRYKELDAVFGVLGRNLQLWQAAEKVYPSYIEELALFDQTGKPAKGRSAIKWLKTQGDRMPVKKASWEIRKEIEKDILLAKKSIDAHSKKVKAACKHIKDLLRDEMEYYSRFGGANVLTTRERKNLEGSHKKISELFDFEKFFDEMALSDEEKRTIYKAVMVLQPILVHGYTDERFKKEYEKLPSDEMVNTIMNMAVNE